MKVEQGQLLVGRLVDTGPFSVFSVKTISRLKSGDRKAWLIRWEPQPEGDGLVIEAQVRFPHGEIAKPWRLLDLYDSTAVVARIEKTLELHTLESTKAELALKAAQSMFRGPS